MLVTAQCESSLFTVLEPHQCLAITSTLLAQTQRHAAPASETNTIKHTIFIPAKAREYVFTGVGLCVCLSVTTITKTGGRLPLLSARPAVTFSYKFLAIMRKYIKEAAE